MELNIDEVIDFWKWFKSISNELLIDPTNTDLIIQIDERIRTFNDFDWEIGPWKDSIYYLSISPGLIADKLEFTREFVKYAPASSGWHFLSSKPSKIDWKGIWKMSNDTGEEILVDSNNWKYILYHFEDKTFDIDVITDDINGNEDTVSMAIDIALTGYLGEEMYMSLIKNISVVNNFEEEYRGKASLIKYIKKHIEQL
ncbi:MAG: hypothetical protein V4560_09250 [Bacteroidota bacterium]